LSKQLNFKDLLNKPTEPRGITVKEFIGILEELPKDFRIVLSTYDSHILEDGETYHTRLDKPITHIYTDDKDWEVTLFSQDIVAPDEIDLGPRLW
jgi:hypothetical protein